MQMLISLGGRWCGFECRVALASFPYVLLVTFTYISYSFFSGDFYPWIYLFINQKSFNDGIAYYHYWTRSIN